LPGSVPSDTLKNYEEEPFSHPNDINVTSKRILGHWVQPSSDPQDLFVSIVLEFAVRRVGKKPMVVLRKPREFPFSAAYEDD
jgi:hypothetical protein